MKTLGIREIRGQALEAQKGRAYAYYMQGDDDALKRGNVAHLCQYTSHKRFVGCAQQSLRAKDN